MSGVASLVVSTSTLCKVDWKVGVAYMGDHSVVVSQVTQAVALEEVKDNLKIKV